MVDNAALLVLKIQLSCALNNQSFKEKWIRKSTHTYQAGRESDLRVSTYQAALKDEEDGPEKIGMYVWLNILP